MPTPEPFTLAFVGEAARFQPFFLKNLAHFFIIAFVAATASMQITFFRWMIRSVMLNQEVLNST